MTMAVFFGIYAVIAGRLVYLGMLDPDDASGPASRVDRPRPDLVDRNGEVLATDIKTASLFAEPRNIVDPDEATESCRRCCPTSRSSRPTQAEQRRRLRLAQARDHAEAADDIMPLGIPGIGFRTENRASIRAVRPPRTFSASSISTTRALPASRNTSTTRGSPTCRPAGFARGDGPRRRSSCRSTSRVQHILRDELAPGDGALPRDRRRARSSSTSRPARCWPWPRCRTTTRTTRSTRRSKDRLNRMSAGIYEMGSTFKSFTTAMALDSGKVTMDDQFDAPRPITHRPLHHPTTSTASAGCSPCPRCSSIPPTSARRARPTSSASRATASS